MVLKEILLGLFPVTLLLEVCLFVSQWLDRSESLKNYRYFLHISLMCQSISYIGSCTDLLVIDTTNYQTF